MELLILVSCIESASYPFGGWCIFFLATSTHTQKIDSTPGMFYGLVRRTASFYRVACQGTDQGPSTLSLVQGSDFIRGPHRLPRILNSGLWLHLIPHPKRPSCISSLLVQPVCIYKASSHICQQTNMLSRLGWKRSRSVRLRGHARVLWRTAVTSTSKKEGDISSVFISLSGHTTEPLPQRFADLKRRLISGHEDQLYASWVRLLQDLREEIEIIAALGPRSIPEIHFDHMRHAPETFNTELRKKRSVHHSGSGRPARSFAAQG